MTLRSAFKMTTLALTALLLGAPAGSQAAEAGPEAASGAEVYRQPIPEMTTLECAKCHPGVFTDIRDRGGLHQLECRQCHAKFHSFQPGLAWEERVPGCRSCHDPVHGTAFVQCLTCHRNAHAPVASMVGVDQLADKCVGCHGPVAGVFEKQPSAHGEVACSDCHHGRHGFRPLCSECHAESHTPFVDNAGCQACHPPHAPLAITLGEGVENGVCQACHPEPAAKVRQSDKKHGKLKCVFCHAGSHGEVPSCRQCHGDGPHNPELLKEFQGCRDCHGDAHTLSLPAKGV
ncbi:c-type cytochrome [Desulfuromonas versatilis]|uniref:C-type cytochrome n=1 Tax=Desulfuromonas versatilis TaxID=2802975 RepID=A0ABN6DTS2_9BACT|nr:cytochrome c3 family protein [Desulfuromonas versatilis]BCR03475.1 c-type cytochrome [Desulfuromonas versatilis]